MAIEKGLAPLSYPASADLSALQYHFVNLASDGEVQAASANGFCLGVLQNNPAAVGRAAAVEQKAGAVTKLGVSTTGGTAIAIGGRIASAASGVGVQVAAGTTVYVAARANEALSTGSTGIIAVTLTHEGFGSTV